MKNTLNLRKCAYIFDSTYNRFFFGTKEQHAKRHRIQKALEEYYYNEDKLLENIPYSTDSGGNIYIELYGEPHRLNALQISHIYGDPEHIINHRKIIKSDNVLLKTNKFHSFTKNSIYSNKFSSLNFEFFTDENTLGYIRVHFKHNSERFIIDSRNGKLFTSGEHGAHQPTNAKEICNRLDITSAAAKKEFFEIINIITEV